MRSLLALASLSFLGAADPDWGQFRGPNRDNISPDTGLLKQWPSGGPPLAWKTSGLGEGFSTVSVLGDRVYTSGDVGGASSVHCLNLADGKILWTTGIGRTGGVRGNGPRSTPATDGTVVVALGQGGELACLDAKTGKVKWKKHYESDFGGSLPKWMWSESPLLDGDQVVITPGGSKGTVAALKKETGELVWQSSGLQDSAHYTSLVPAEIGGVRQYLVLTPETVAGIAAKDGKVLWRARRKGQTAVIPTPIYKDGIVFVTSGYGIGCHAFRVTASGGQFKAEEIYANPKVENHHGDAVLVGDHLYEMDNSRTLKCVELKTGNIVWQDRGVGKGALAYADGMLYCRGEATERGGPAEVALVEATPSGYKEKGRFTQPDRTNTAAWAHPVVFGGKFYIRDQDVLLCYDVKAK